MREDNLCSLRDLRGEFILQPQAEMFTGTIFDIRRYSIHDGPGIRTAVFLKGCPLDCHWCHNPEGRASAPELIFRPARCILCDDCLDVCPNDAISKFPSPTGGGAGDGGINIDRSRCRASGNCAVACPAEALEIVGRMMTAEQVVAEVERDRTFYEQSGGGVTFTGGEPLFQPRFLMDLLSTCRIRDLHTAVDTSGFAPWPDFEKIRPLVDLFLYDLKLMDTAHHIKWTGVSNEIILSNLRRLAGKGSRIQVRIPLVPGINDDEENLHATGAFLASLPKVPPVELLAYHNIAEAKYTGLGKEYPLKEINPPTTGRIKECATVLSGYGLELKR